MVKEKTIRKNLAFLDDAILLGGKTTTDPVVDLTTVESKLKTMKGYPGSEMDRYMIAFLRLQTEGRVAYRRLLGMHGGGFGTAQDKEQIDLWKSSGKTQSSRPLMMVKADLDKDRVILEDFDTKHNTQADSPTEWPSPQNNVCPAALKEGEEYLAHIFCWHGQSPFLSWHRPFMVEFERLLQEYDPLFPGLHHGRNALGAHYYDWDGWDGMSFPPFINYPSYKIKTVVFDEKVLPQMESFNKDDRTITNPLYRWFAPMLPSYQLSETFPSDGPNENNCTTREPALSDISGSVNFEYSFPKNDTYDGPSIETSIREAMRESDYLAFCTTTHNGNKSIENGHNHFHNRVGGESGTMSPLQSSFDPIFMLHHSNVERQFISWQRVWVPRGGKTSLPPKWLMDTRLYPWTKPHLVKKGALSWNTKADVDEDGKAAEKTVNDGTVQDWWNHEELEYEYDEYVPVTKPLKSEKNFGKSSILMTVWTPVLTSGSFDLYVSNGNREVKINSVSLIIGNNAPDSTTTTCFQCQKRSHLTLVYDVTGFATPHDFTEYNSDNESRKENSVINNFFIRHKGEKYPVNSNDPSKSITVRSVREAKKHMKAIRTELKKRHKAEPKKDSNGLKWSCLS